MNKPRMLDLFCCQGGASAGYVNAGFKVCGIDKDAQPHYPYSFFQRDALTFLKTHGKHFDAVHASPPCQAFTNAQKIRGNDHPDLIEPTRELLEELGKPYVIENVPGSPVREDVVLCGPMFGLETYRHRVFEFGFMDAPTPPAHPAHSVPTTKMGRPPVRGEFMHVVGNFSGVDRARSVMGMPWATQQGLREAIPPAYTEWIGRHILDQVGV